jgi:hypothetical protein
MMQFKAAERTQVKLKVGIQGPSGSGKTLGALALARSIVGPSGKIAVIDTENASASYYADRFAFDVLNLEAPYTSARYVEAIKAAIGAGYDIAVIDSLSHQWAGSGGILERKDASDKRGGNSFANWAGFTKEHELFKTRILEAPIHIIGTLRAKQEYALVEDNRGKQAPKKMGLAPIQREGFEYELGVVFDVQMDHKAHASKDRTGLFPNDELVDLTDALIGKRLNDWLGSAKPTTPAAEFQDDRDLVEA